MEDNWWEIILKSVSLGSLAWFHLHPSKRLGILKTYTGNEHLDQPPAMWAASEHDLGHE